MAYGSGEKAAWEHIKERGAGISRTTGIPFENGAFGFRCLGMDFYIRPDDETIEAADGQGKALLAKFSYFFNHLALWWLVCSKGITAAGKLVKPEGLPGGEAFFRGTHTLPLDGIARRYGRDREGFLKRAQSLGWQGPETGPAGSGGKTGPALPSDISVLLSPAPGFPVHILLWLEDEEYPARADILLPSSVGVILPLDVIWCAAMLCLLAMF